MKKRGTSAAPRYGDLLTVSQAAKRWGVHPSRVRQWIAEQRIPGVILLGHSWVIPSTAQRPRPRPPGPKPPR